MPHFQQVSSGEDRLIRGIITFYTQWKESADYITMLDSYNPPFSQAFDVSDVLCIGLRMEWLLSRAIDLTIRLPSRSANSTEHLTEDNFIDRLSILDRMIREHTNGPALYELFLQEIFNLCRQYTYDSQADLINNFYLKLDELLLSTYNLRLLSGVRVRNLVAELRIRLERPADSEELLGENGEDDPPLLTTTAGDRVYLSPFSGSQQNNIMAYQSPVLQPRKRPEKEGENNIAHNLTTRYQACIGLWNDIKNKTEKAILITQFVKGKEELMLYGKEYLNTSMESLAPTKEIIVPYSEKYFFLPTPFSGWVMGDLGLYYLELIPGTYLRGISHNNLALRWFINSTTIQKNSGLYWTKQIIFNLLKGSFISLDEGIAKNLPFFTVNQKVAAVLRKKHEKEKLFILINDLCIGEYNVHRKRVKVYKYYEKIKSLIEQTLEYEVE